MKSENIVMLIAIVLLLNSDYMPPIDGGQKSAVRATVRQLPVIGVAVLLRWEQGAHTRAPRIPEDK